MPPTVTRSSGNSRRSWTGCRSRVPVAWVSGSGRARRSPSRASTHLRSMRPERRGSSRAPRSTPLASGAGCLEGQAASSRHLEAQRPFGIALEVDPGGRATGFFAETSGPAYEAARIALRPPGAARPDDRYRWLDPARERSRRRRAGRRDPPARNDRRVCEHPRAERTCPLRRVREGRRSPRQTSSVALPTRPRQERRRPSMSGAPSPPLGRPSPRRGDGCRCSARSSVGATRCRTRRSCFSGCASS